MKKLYRRWMQDWENRLCYRTNNRVIRPFEWGLEWAEKWPVAQQYSRNGHAPEQYLHALNDRALRNSESLFGYERPSDFRLDGDMLRFTSAVSTPFAKNNIVHAQWHPAKKHKGRAVVVLPHWNASFEQH